MTTATARYKKFIDNGNGDCVYCGERRYDCCCSEKTAASLGYHYDPMPVDKTVERPPMPKGLSKLEELTFLVTNPTSEKTELGAWRKGKKFFQNINDLVDYHNIMDNNN